MQFVVADVPGLIPGASTGKGLGLDFLRHIERCLVFVHVLDCATEEPGRDPISDLDALEAELAAYEELTGARMADRPRIVALNKIDVPAGQGTGRPGRARARGPRADGAPGLGRHHRGPAGSGVHHGVGDRGRRAPPLRRPSPPGIVLRPRASRRTRLRVVAIGENSFRSSATSRAAGSSRPTSPTTRPLATWPTGWPSSGIEQALADAGATAGAEVLIGEEDNSVVFDWDPMSPRGVPRPARTDARLG